MTIANYGQVLMTLPCYCSEALYTSLRPSGHPVLEPQCFPVAWCLTGRKLLDSKPKYGGSSALAICTKLLWTIIQRRAKRVANPRIRRSRGDIYYLCATKAVFRLLMPKGKDCSTLDSRDTQVMLFYEAEMHALERYMHFYSKTPSPSSILILW